MGLVENSVEVMLSCSQNKKVVVLWLDLGKQRPDFSILSLSHKLNVIDFGLNPFH